MVANAAGSGGARCAMIWFDTEKSCNAKNDELKTRVDLQKESKIGQVGHVNGVMMISRDL